MNIEKILDNYYQKDEPIVLACSTWPDSMYILYKILETKYAKNVIACYFNHKLRDEADKEEKFLEDLWTKYWFQVEIAECKIKEIKERFYSNLSIEEVARNKRYEFFNAILNIYTNTDKIITWHHLDDKIETFFFNMVRGSKLSWLINMKELNWWILRPLLNLEKNEILDYLDKNNLKYNIDESNFENIYTRNKLRNNIIPQFSEVNPAYKKNLNNLMTYFEELQKDLEARVEDFLTEQWILIFNSKKYKINTLEINGYFYIEDFNKESTLLQKEIIKQIYFKSNWNSTIGLSEWNIAEVIKFINWKNNKTVKEINSLLMKKENTIIIY